MQNHIAQNTKLILTPRRAALLAGFDNQLDILVRLQAPDAPAEAKRNGLYGIGLVIDHSGSMAGRPLEEAKRCAAFVVDRMRADDQISLVQFDNRVGMLCPTAESRWSRTVQAIASIHGAAIPTSTGLARRCRQSGRCGHRCRTSARDPTFGRLRE